MAVFEELSALNVNERTEKKNVSGKELTYLSWPWAWAEVKKRYPDAHYTIWRNENGLPYTVDPETGYMVYTSVTIDGITHEMWLPVMNGANKAMKPKEYEYQVGSYKKKCEAATMTDINKTIMRCLVKNLAMFGLGLYIYAGEDLPETDKENAPEPQAPKNTPVQRGNGPENGSVTTARTIPQAQEQAADQAPETPGAYIKRKIAELHGKDPSFNFMQARAELIKSGVIEDVPSATMNMDQAKALIAAVAENCVKAS